VLLTGGMAVPGGGRGEDRRDVTFAEPAEGGGVTEGPIGALRAVKPASSTASAILTLTRLAPLAPTSINHIRAPSRRAKNAASAQLVALGSRFKGPSGTGRVVGVVDHRVTGCGEPVAGDLGGATPSEVGDHELVAGDAGPHNLISEGVGDRVGDPAVRWPDPRHKINKIAKSIRRSFGHGAWSMAYHVERNPGSPVRSNADLV